MNFACFHEVVALQKLPGKREDVAALAHTEVVPELFRHVHTERGCALIARYGARYHSSLPLLLTGSCPSRARKSASGIFLTCIYFRPFHARVS